MRKKKEVKDIKPGVIRYINEDTDQIKKFILILVGVALIALLLYFVTAKYLIKDAFQKEEESITESTINYDSVMVGTIFNRSEDKYYVLAYDKTGTDANYLNTLASRYSGGEKIYTLDLSLDVNKNYVSDKGNSKATNPSEISLVDPTLMLIENASITKYYEGSTDIAAILK